MQYIMIIILWSIFALLAIDAFTPLTKPIDIKTKIFVVILIYLTAPFLAISNIVNNIMNIISPEGGDDDDLKKH